MFFSLAIKGLGDSAAEKKGEMEAPILLPSGFTNGAFLARAFSHN